MHPKKMTISRFAQAGNVGVETVRFYQRQGLLPVPSAKKHGYREYNDELLQQLNFIRRAQSAGFSLAEIKQLLHFDPVANRQQIQSLTRQRLDQLTAKITELQTIAAALETVLQDCYQFADSRSCPIIKALQPSDPRADA